MDNWLTTRRLGVLLGLMVVAGLGIHFYQQKMEEKEQAGKSALHRIQQTYEQELNALPEAQRATGVTLDVDAKFPKTVAELNGVLNAKSISSRALFDASMKLGTLYLDHNEPTKAVNALKSMPDHAKTDFQKASAYFLLGTAQTRAGLDKEAADTFQQGLKKNIEGLNGEFLVGIIRSLVKVNDVEKAKTFLEKLRKDLPGSKALETGERLIAK